MFVICWGIISPWYEEIKLIKVTSVIKHRNMAKEIMIYTDRVYSLLLKLEKKTKYNITFALHSCSPYHADFAFELRSNYISVRGYTNMMAVT